MPHPTRNIQYLGRPAGRFLTQPETPHIADIRGDTDRDLVFAMLDSPAEGCAQIVDFAIKPVMRQTLIRTAPDLEMPVGIGREELGMA